MNYYSIQFTLNPKLRGSNEYVKKYHIKIPNDKLFWEEPKFIGNIYNEKVDFKPYLTDIELFVNSKINDLIMDGGPITKKMIVSGKLKSILEKYRSSGMQFYNINIIQKNNIFKDYWILNMYETNFEVIDFIKSEFYETENVFNLIKKIDIKSIDEFLKFKSEIELKDYPYGFIISKIALKDDITLDFFSLLYVECGIKYVVSEKLKQEIEDAGCTGIEFQPIEMKLTEWLQGGEREKVYGKS